MTPGKELGLAIAVVSNRDDPDRLGRVRVRFPTLDDRESDWSPVTVPFGGAQSDAHGFFWVPEVGDTVVAGFDQGDGKSVIILGSIYSRKQAPPAPDKDTRIIQTTKKHFIKIVEDPGRITIETADRQRIDIDTSSKEITVEANATVTIKGARAVNIDGGATVTVKATSVTVDAQSIALGAGASNPVVLGQEFVALFSAHTHPVLGPATGPPVPLPLLAKVLSTSTRVAK